MRKCNDVVPLGVLQLTLQNILYSFPVVLLWNTCVCCNWRQHLQRLSPHGLHKHQYLSSSSCHPKHCFKSIPFSQAIRVKRICSTVETTKQRLGDLRHHLKKRGYNDKVILDRGGSIKEGHFGFRHFVCELYRRMDTVGMFEKIINLFIAMYPLHVDVIY
jgi:hypothetical protein